MEARLDALALQVSRTGGKEGQRDGREGGARCPVPLSRVRGHDTPYIRGHDTLECTLPLGRVRGHDTLEEEQRTCLHSNIKGI